MSELDRVLTAARNVVALFNEYDGDEDDRRWLEDQLNGSTYQLDRALSKYDAQQGRKSQTLADEVAEAHAGPIDPPQTDGTDRKREPAEDCRHPWHAWNIAHRCPNCEESADDNRGRVLNEAGFAMQLTIGGHSIDVQAVDRQVHVTLGRFGTVRLQPLQALTLTASLVEAVSAIKD